MSIITILLIVIVALLAGMEGVLDELQFHQPLVTYMLIGVVSGHMKGDIVLGGSLQVMALGWTNVGAAITPDAALASVASVIIIVLGLQDGATDVNNTTFTSIAVTVPLSVAGLFLTIICHTTAIPMAHFMDATTERGNIRVMRAWQVLAILLQDVRIAIPAATLCVVSLGVVTDVLNQVPSRLFSGMVVGGSMVAAVGYAVVINVMAARETWPFFALGSALAALNQLALIALGVIDVVTALIYLGPKEHGGSNNGGGSNNTGDPLDDILSDY